MKRITILLVLVVVLAAGVSAHDKGDLMLNIEPQIGAVMGPVIYDNMTPGIDLGLRTTTHYYLTDWFSFNTGLGLGFNYHNFVTVSSNAALVFVPIFGWAILAFQGLQTEVINMGHLFAPYVTIPLGFRLAPRAFVMGAGVTFNIPIHYSKDNGEGDYTQEGYNSAIYGREDIYHRLDTLFNTGWYVDLGFDLSGRKGKKNGFGTLLRLAGSFVDTFTFDPPMDIEIDDSSSLIKFTNSFLSLSLVFQFSVELANLSKR